MKYKLIECLQYHELEGEVKKKVKEEIEMMFPELTTKEKADLLWTADGDRVSDRLGEILDSEGLANYVYEGMNGDQEQGFFDELTNGQDEDKIVKFIDDEQAFYEALDAKHGYKYHDDVLICDPSTENSDMELRQILLNIWENKENLKFNKQVEELKFYE